MRGEASASSLFFQLHLPHAVTSGSGEWQVAMSIGHSGRGILRDVSFFCELHLLKGLFVTVSGRCEWLVVMGIGSL